jgi:LemA protein
MGRAIGCLGVLVIAALAYTGFTSYNALVGKDEAVNTAWAQVENVYQRRADLIPNLVETVRGAADFERSTLESVIEARSRATGITFENAPTADDLAQFSAAQGELSSALSRLLAVVEDYPELRATEAFRDLQSQIEGTENRITVERQRFNEVAQDFNTAVRRFPTSIFSGMMGFASRAYFEAQPGAETAPEVDFSRN